MSSAQWNRRRAVGAGLGALAAALSGCSAGDGPARRLRLATGPQGGPYNAFGRALAQAVAAGGGPLEIAAVGTAASVDNLRRLEEGSVDLALAMADVAEGAVTGREPFSRPAAVTALARVYVNHTHLVVPARGPVRSVADLAGRTVAAGATGSGVQVVADRVLRAAGPDGGRTPVRERHLGLDASVGALREGSADALFWSGGVPTPALSALARAFPLRMLPLDGYVGALRERYGPVYQAVTLPAGAYGMTEPVGTIGVGNYLLARADVPDDAVRELLRVLFGRWRDLLREVTAGARLEPRFAISTGGVPLHPGAVDHYRSVYG
ncbi:MULTISPECIES: TAXI family TRAP transporter solute-binding subunit [Streptomyces]|uniref:TAXI family TRAP transporter solute-binding subunit n=1 Tax=Streptomyces TaxID=1883 RepID=UPI00226DAA62|nr:MULTISPECIES: TAXI family TRAP transporter solute-binding subunit [unclassified Streptomyces]MCY0943096.1 TAXI family TRAP transporter solute-binding subunit [Streptomyces sp. H34-AA3]MCY0949725.1 TAXI family TRAP transporter solute-binding subunit [Streptomyces sp. H27-S2]MCZ4084457.1 TAXI family TRAP transporter solute-binding subunit [Streptomyces sp. H34-S5]